MFFHGALWKRRWWDRGCGDSVNTSQSWGPQRWNGIAHPESEKVKFIFSIFFFLPFLSLTLPYTECIKTTKSGPFFFFTMMYNSHLLIKKKILPEVIHLDFFFFFLNRKRVSDVYMLKSKAANLPTNLTGIDNCQIFSLYMTGFWAELGICSIFFLKQQNNCYHAITRFLVLLANTEQSCLGKSNPAFTIQWITSSYAYWDELFKEGSPKKSLKNCSFSGVCRWCLCLWDAACMWKTATFNFQVTSDK